MTGDAIVLVKLRFRDGLVWTVGLTVEMKLRFQITPVKCGRGLREREGSGIIRSRARSTLFLDPRANRNHGYVSTKGFHKRITISAKHRRCEMLIISVLCCELSWQKALQSRSSSLRSLLRKIDKTSDFRATFASFVYRLNFDWF